MLHVPMMRGCHYLLPLVVFLSAVVTSAQEVTFERVLLPVTVRHSFGANGAIWTTDLRLSVDPVGDKPLIVPLLGLSACDPPCPTPLLLPDNGRTISIDFYRTHEQETTGSYMYLQRAKSQAAHLALTVHDEARGTMPTELPVVHEDEFASGTLRLLDVPAAPTARAMLRVYGSDPSATGEIELQVFDDASDERLLESRLPLTVHQLEMTTGTGTFALRPPVVEVRLDQFAAADRNLRLLVTPLNGIRIWCFVTVTENSSQHIIVRTPR